MKKIEIKIPRDDFKMHIIGREGCNIETFQQELGVKILIDDTPDKIFLIGEDKILLEIARAVMEKLIRNNKINPEEIKRYKKILG
jgi:rRNA processing protein Krr1/Pno1